jgi:hypothetical protein
MTRRTIRLSRRDRIDTYHKGLIRTGSPLLAEDLLSLINSTRPSDGSVLGSEFIQPFAIIPQNHFVINLDQVVNLSTLRPKGRGLLEVHPEPRFSTPP